LIKAVFFDLIGTIIYAKKAFSFEEVSNYLFSRGYEISPQQFKASWLFVTFVDYPRFCYKNWEEFLNRVLQRLNIEIDKTTFKNLIKIFEKCEYALYPDVENAFSRIRNLGLKIAVITTTPLFMFCESIKPIRRHLDCIITGCEAGCDKSNPRMYVKALKLLEVRPEECIVVGDDPQLDVAIPKRLGMYTILLDRQLSHKDSIADAIAESLDKVAEIIERKIAKN